MLTSNNYYKPAKKGIVTIKIAISAYHAAFGADINVGIGIAGGEFAWGAFPEGKWNAATGYTVKIYDKSNGNEIKYAKNIGKVASKSNLGGFITAKNILNTTYIQANQELFFFIDECFM